MGLEVGLAAAGLAISAAGTAASLYYQGQQADAQKEALAAQQRAEAARRRAMELDAMRRRREIIRSSLKARALALSTATAQGAGAGSGLAGAQAGISGQTSTNLLGVSQNLELGQDIFSANADRLSAESRGVSAQGGAAIGGALTSLGGMIMKNTSTIDRIGGALFRGAVPGAY